MIRFTLPEYEAWCKLTTDTASARLSGKMRHSTERAFEIRDEHILSKAHERTIAGLSTDELYSDTVAAIMFEAYNSIIIRESVRGSVDSLEPHEETWLESVTDPQPLTQFDIFAQIDELHRRPDGAKYHASALELWQRYRASEISRAEAEPYRDYQPFEILREPGKG